MRYISQRKYVFNPRFTITDKEEQPIGIWGQRLLDYLQNYRKVTYTNLPTSSRR